MHRPRAHLNQSRQITPHPTSLTRGQTVPHSQGLRRAVEPFTNPALIPTTRTAPGRTPAAPPPQPRAPSSTPRASARPVRAVYATPSQRACHVLHSCHLRPRPRPPCFASRLATVSRRGQIYPPTSTRFEPMNLPRCLRLPKHRNPNHARDANPTSTSTGSSGPSGSRTEAQLTWHGRRSPGVLQACAPVQTKNSYRGGLVGAEESPIIPNHQLKSASDRLQIKCIQARWAPPCRC